MRSFRDFSFRKLIILKGNKSGKYIMLIEISEGEALDRLSILEIKNNRITDSLQLLEIQKEILSLSSIYSLKNKYILYSQNLFFSFVKKKIY